MELIISRNKDKLHGMDIEFFKLNESYYLTLKEVSDNLPEEYNKLSLSILKKIVNTNLIPDDVVNLYPEFEYYDNVTSIPTTYGSIKEYSVCTDKINILVIRQLGVHLEVLETTYELNGIPYKNIRSMISVLVKEKGYKIKFGELRHAISKMSVERLLNRFPNMTITEKRQKRINPSDVKYAIDCQVLSKSGHHSSISFNPVQHEFRDSDDIFRIVRIDNNYYLNDDMLGASDQLLTKLNQLGVDITKNQFRMIIGHKKIPKSLLSKYPNMSYQHIQ